jgi:hypothetical protein
MSQKPAVWCARCNLRIAPYDLLTVYHGTNYHQDCFLRVVRDEAYEKKRGHAFSEPTSKEAGENTNQPARVRGRF